jgi:hypothetical protein
MTIDLCEGAGNDVPAEGQNFVRSAFSMKVDQKNPPLWTKEET